MLSFGRDDAGDVSGTADTVTYGAVAASLAVATALTVQLQSETRGQFLPDHLLLIGGKLLRVHLVSCRMRRDSGVSLDAGCVQRYRYAAVGRLAWVLPDAGVIEFGRHDAGVRSSKFPAHTIVVVTGAGWRVAGYAVVAEGALVGWRSGPGAGCGWQSSVLAVGSACPASDPFSGAVHYVPGRPVPQRQWASARAGRRRNRPRTVARCRIMPAHITGQD